jgi:hypothetical protein
MQRHTQSHLNTFERRRHVDVFVEEAIPVAQKRRSHHTAKPGKSQRTDIVVRISLFNYMLRNYIT